MTRTSNIPLRTQIVANVTDTTTLLPMPNESHRAMVKASAVHAQPMDTTLPIVTPASTSTCSLCRPVSMRTVEMPSSRNDMAYRPLVTRNMTRSLYMAMCWSLTDGSVVPLPSYGVTAESLSREFLNLCDYRLPIGV